MATVVAPVALYIPTPSTLAVLLFRTKQSNSPTQYLPNSYGTIAMV